VTSTVLPLSGCEHMVESLGYGLSAGYFD